ncbi:MAG: hypothetical protein GY774_16725 [Planctomycetes bacterium]|nr:hypothetical protein [Planctomycetota bacterium]
MIKNYTSSIPASRSVQYIENKLVVHGAKQIMKEYDDDKRLAAICFIIMVEGKELPFKLPARTEQCEAILLSRIKRPTEGTHKRVKEQAERTAWKLLRDWTDVQMSLVELGQVDILEVFLSFAYDVVEGKTYFEKLKDRKFKGLIEGPKR